MSDIDAILGQMLVAFGHGVGSLRVPRSTVTSIQDRYSPVLKSGLSNTWEKDGVQVLERVRACGRLSAQLASERGDTKVEPEDFKTAAARTEATSNTPICPSGS